MLVFIDESGMPYPKDSTINPVLCGVCIEESDIKEVSRKIYRLKMNIFGKDTEIKSTSLIRRRIIEKNMTNNKKFVDEFVKTACSFNINVFAIIMNKPDSPYTPSEKMIPKHYKYLISRIEHFCEKHDNKKAILVFDEVPGKDIIIAKFITNFLFKSRIGKKFNRILEMPFFVSSEVTPAIQIADIFAGIIRHYYENGLDKKLFNEVTNPFETWIYSLYLQIIAKTENFNRPNTKFVEYGFYKMNKKIL